MSEDLIIRHCAPTLAGIKTGNMFTASYDSIKQLDEDIRRINLLLRGKGIKVVRLRTRDNRALIYVYRPVMLADDLDREEAKAILARSGYRLIASPAEHIIRLSKRINDRFEFPHEIGIFLGYPPEDVKGFIECGGQRCKACGLWKVYGDVPSAERLFRKYRKCKCVYIISGGVLMYFDEKSDRFSKINCFDKLPRDIAGAGSIPFGARMMLRMGCRMGMIKIIEIMFKA